MLYKDTGSIFNGIIEQVHLNLKRDGYSQINIGLISREQFVNLCYSFGELIPSGRNHSITDDIYTDINNGNKSLPLHTDKSYWRIPPRFEMLYVESIKGMFGGEMLISNLWLAFDLLSNEDKEYLIQYATKYKTPENRDGGYIIASLVNFLNKKLSFFRFRLDIFDSDIPAINNWCHIIDQNKQTIEYNAGDFIVFDNWTFAAGRKDTYFLREGFRRIYRALVI